MNLIRQLCSRCIVLDNLIENDEATNFIIKQDNDYAKILNSDITVMTAYKFNRKALENPNAYKKIYE